MTSDAGVLAVGLATIATFVAAFHVSGLVARALAALTVARETMGVIADKTLDDEKKEPLVQRAAIRLFGQFGLITATSIVVLAVPGLVMWGSDLIGLAAFAAVSDFLLNWEVIIGATVVIPAANWLMRRG
jgi:hypothetical protein